MVLAGEHTRLAFLFGYDWKRPVSTDVVEPIDLSLVVSDKEELEPGFCKSYPGTTFRKSELVGHEDPFFGEYGPPFKFVDIL